MAAIDFVGAARNWDDELERLLADTGCRLERTFGKWRRGKVMASAGLLRGGKGGRDHSQVRKLGTCLRCWNGYRAKTESARFDTEISRRKAIAGFPLGWIEVALGFRGQIPRLEEGSGRVDLFYAG